MLQPNDLKIGNWYNISLLDYSISKDYQLNKAQLIEQLRYESYIIKPISLTEEWLKKFGFRKKETNDEFLTLDYYRWEFRIDDRLGMSIFCESESGHLNLMYVSPDYVHELQNFFFVLIGKDLQPSEAEGKNPEL